jgi:hypothetical protein
MDGKKLSLLEEKTVKHKAFQRASKKVETRDTFMTKVQGYCIPFCAFSAQGLIFASAKIFRMNYLRALSFCEVLQDLGKFAKLAIF